MSCQPFQKSRLGFLVAVVALMSIPLHAIPAKAYSGERLEKYARVSMKQARVIAHKARPGKITDEELEKERGGSGLRYSFDIRHRGRTYEVGVDAKTGRVLENMLEGRNPD
jgi:uncharacterized membrane protein YkoI